MQGCMSNHVRSHDQQRCVTSLATTHLIGHLASPMIAIAFWHGPRDPVTTGTASS